MNNEHNFALVKNGLVINVIVFNTPNPDNDLLNLIKKEHGCTEIIKFDEFNTAGPGWRWDGEKFLEPISVDKTSFEE